MLTDNPVIIFGTTGLAKAALEIFNSNGIVVYGFLDDDEKTHSTQINGIPIVGSTKNDAFLRLIGRKCGAFVATDDYPLHKKYVTYLNEYRKIMPVNAIHKSAIIATSCSIGHGNFINAGVILSNNTKIGHHNIINTNAIIEQEVQMANYVQIGANSVINPKVTIEEGAFIGSGATIVAGITIGKKTRIGAGSVVVNHVEKNQTIFGNPATQIKETH